MKASTALLELFKEEQEWRQFYRACCEMSAYRLAAQTWQFRDELADRGHHFLKDEIADALLTLLHELLPSDSCSASLIHRS
jgi:hypothetical protein